MGLTYAEADRCGIAHLWPKPPTEGSMKGNKYNAVRTEYNGVSYASKAEARHAEQLDAEVASGITLWWLNQPKFRLGVPENVYVADALVVRPEGVHVRDVKGVMTAKFTRDCKLWRKYGPCSLWVIRGGKIDIVPGRPR